MQTKIGQVKSKEEAVTRNQAAREIKMMPGAGCIDTLVCEACLSIIRDSLCCCVGLMCPECGWTNIIKVFGKLPYNPATITIDTIKIPETPK